MRLSVRLTLVFGGLGLLTIPTVAGLSWLLADDEVRASIDDQLLEQADRIQAIGATDIAPGDGTALPPGVDPGRRQRVLDEATLTDPPDPFLGDERGIRFYDAQGETVNGAESYLDDAVVRRLAAGESGFLSTTTVDERSIRTMTIALDSIPFVPATDVDVVTLQLFADITTDEAALSGLAVSLIAASVAGVLIVVAGALVVGRWLARPVQEVTDAAEQLAELDDLPGRIVTNRSDELGRLASSFNRMLSALEVGREQQQRLVADASHELRTPLTALRMRSEFLARTPDIEPARRQELLDATVADAAQLSALVADLVDLAADIRSGDEQSERVALAAVVDTVARRSALASGRRIDVDADDSEVIGRPGMIERAVRNLIDNAVKYSPPPTTVTVRVADGTIEVDDDGPGIADDELDLVFDRFYRSPKARGRPGNGIGLAIVKQVAETHHGEVWATRHPGGGGRVGFSMQTACPPTRRSSDRAPATRSRVTASPR